MIFFYLLDKIVKKEYLEIPHSNVFLRHWSYLLVKVVEKFIQQKWTFYLSEVNITMLCLHRQKEEWMISRVLCISKWCNSAALPAPVQHQPAHTLNTDTEEMHQGRSS